MTDWSFGLWSLDAIKEYFRQGDQSVVRRGAADDVVTLENGANAVLLGPGDDTLTATGRLRLLRAEGGDDTVTVEDVGFADLGAGDDSLSVSGFAFQIFTRIGDDLVRVENEAIKIDLGAGDDGLIALASVREIFAGAGADVVSLAGSSEIVSLGAGDDALEATGHVRRVYADAGDDVVSVTDGGIVRLGAGDDRLTVEGAVDRVLGDGGDDVVTLVGTAARVDGGDGVDALILNRASGAFDIEANGDFLALIDRFTGARTSISDVEQFQFTDGAFDVAALQEIAAPATGLPSLRVADGTQAVTVNDVDPTVSVVWDRAVQQAVIETGPGPTVASRAYAMLHTAMYDAWASYDAVAVRVSLDEDGDNAALEAGLVSNDANKIKAMSYAAHTVLTTLFPAQTALFDAIMVERYGFDPAGDGGAEAAVGLDAAQDLLTLRAQDGSEAESAYQPVNPSPLEIVDITRWTPESVPIDPEDGAPEQSFLTPQWGGVQGFALPEDADGQGVFDALRPAAPQPFFAEGFEGSVLDLDAKTITLSAPAVIDGVSFTAGSEVAVSKAMIGVVINEGFIAQAEEVIDFSAELDDEDKIIAEFWEDGGGTAFPPGTFMAFAQWVSARNGNSVDDDAKLFLAMGNSVMDAGIATWEAKVFYDYVRPVRAIRDLGELGLIGEEGEDFKGQSGFVIEAFAGFDADGNGLGTRDILAEEFITFQRPGADPSPPFAEYTSGHSAFSAAGAETLRLFTGDDDFGAAVTFAPGSTQFEAGVPAAETTLSWSTFSDAADEAGLSRLYGGIHFTEGDVNGRELGREVGAAAFEAAMLFYTGEATDEDRPFFFDDLA